MSYDRKIDQVCSHYVREEPLFFDGDRVTVTPLRPIAASSSVRVRINGVANVPSQGYEIAARAKGSVAGPYNIAAGVNDTLVVSVNGRPDQTLVAKPGMGVSARQLAIDLNKKIQNAKFGVTKRSQLKLDTHIVGPRARIHIKPGSTLASTIGFAIQRVHQGKKPYPGWSLIRDPNTLNDRPTRRLVFDAQVPGLQDYIEIDYTTVRQECRRCGGLGVENDWVYGVTGEVIQVRDEALLIQELLKIMFTLQGSNIFHPWYGTNVLDTVGKKIVAAGIIQSFIVSDIKEAFRRWQNIKKQQEEDVGQEVTDREYPFRILNVVVEQSDKDPTVLFVNSTVQSRSQEPLQIDRGVRIPEPTDLLGATAQQGIFRRSLTDFQLVG